MRAALLTFCRNRRTFILYCIIGATGVTIDYGSFLLMVNWLGANYLVANVFSTSLGIVNNFLLNRMFNFKMQDRFWRRFASFYAIGLLGLGVSTILLYIMVGLFHLGPDYAKLATLAVVVILQYNLNRLISFRK
jgi:putative flippase GtrA